MTSTRPGTLLGPPLTFPTAEREQSRPPSYRSRTSSAGGILRSCVGVFPLSAAIVPCKRLRFSGEHFLLP
ncbi:hypothetical protein IscW_ISCW006173 [Ixodes scapularis]|uniref:Uncharacterized protein n=1 Tax=Ixodes scapularis TaxID=6945 RepID=B7PQ99_IXOSC|nr:hypothetical protein IscW_ISCW006173 [Ixodes scapularis]|eukprot:XP_002435941.1 hypothetical protein IscW_ISCW006173 [Ixodes scapularis]